MGTDKAWLEIGGRAMIEHVIAQLAPAASSIAIIANDQKYGQFGYPVFADANRGVGPLEAIRTALVNATTGRVILVGCDMPFVTRELFSFLLDVKGDYRAIIPLSADDELQPLCAIYHRDALPVVASLIENGTRKVSVLFESIAARFVRFDELSHLQGAELFFQNINTPEDYARAVNLLGGE
jgi:molybdopterin-guanine dinucleotide biosynthesis protein A